MRIIPQYAILFKCTALMLTIDFLLKRKAHTRYPKGLPDFSSIPTDPQKLEVCPYCYYARYEL